MSRDVAKMSRAGRGLSRLSRGWVAARRAAVAVCRAADAAGRRVARCRGVLRGVEGGSPPITPPSRAGRHPSRRRRGLSRGVAGVAGHIISVKTAACTWTPIGGGGVSYTVGLEQIRVLCNVHLETPPAAVFKLAPDGARGEKQRTRRGLPANVHERCMWPQDIAIEWSL